MIVSFVYFYLLGTFIYFIHMSLVIAISTKEITHSLKLNEEEGEQLFTSYFARVLFQSIIMAVFPILFGLYIKINTYFSNTLLVSSGLFSILWMLATGATIRGGYYFATHKINTFKIFNYDIHFKDKEFFWIVCPLLYGILFSLYDYKIFFTIFAIVLGKYIWMDSFPIRLFSKIEIKKYIKKVEIDVFLLIIQALVMGYLIVRWYPIRSENIDRNNGDIFLILGFVLMPMLDYFIVVSINKYAKFIKEKH